MLYEVAALFVERNGCTVRTLASKSNASAPAPANTLVQVAQEGGFLITLGGGDAGGHSCFIPSWRRGRGSLMQHAAIAGPT